MRLDHRTGGSTAVSTSHDAATEAGAQVLAAGGTAVDAAIAAAAMLCVVYPNNVALGGDLVALVRDPAGRTTFVNATGRSASGQTLEHLTAVHDGEMPVRGVDTITVPGGVRGWKALAAIGGTRSWCELLGPARNAAVEGHPVARSVARAIQQQGESLAEFESWRRTFMPQGRPLAEGDLLIQTALGETFGGLMAGGPDAFYVGELAERWVNGLRSAGSLITMEDAAASTPTIHDPIYLDVLGYRVLTSPPNTQGFSLLRTLGRLASLGLADPLRTDPARLAMLFHEANRVREIGLADPEVGMTAAQLIDMEAPRFSTPSSRSAKGDTVGLVAVSDGWAVSLVQSVYEPFGSGVIEPHTGILFHDRGAGFSLEPGRAAAFAPRRRPPHTLMPVLTERAGQLAFATATMGGQAQPQIHTHLLLQLFSGSSAVEATSRPRWLVGRQDDNDTADSLIIEADVDSETVRSLGTTPLLPRIVPPRSESVGHSNVIRYTSAGLDAASDPRSDGSARILPLGPA